MKNIFKKEKALKLDDFFKLVRPEYTYLKIMPHKSIKNYNTENIAKTIAFTNAALNKRLSVQKKEVMKKIPIPCSITVNEMYHITYIVDITKDDVSFYFQVPKSCRNIYLEKITEIWGSATISEVESIDDFKPDSICYELSYKNEDALSLEVNKKSNEPLNSILSVIDIMKDDDRVTILYNFIPRSQKAWKQTYKNTLDRYADHLPVIKKKLSFEYISKEAISLLLQLIDGIGDAINDFIGTKKNENMSLAAAISATLLETDPVIISTQTKRKKDSRIMDNQIAVISSSGDNARRADNVLAVCGNYKALDGNNELIPKQVKEIPRLTDRVYKNIELNIVSTDEASNFIQLPARSLIEQYKIGCIETTENQVPEQLKDGYFKLGKVTYKGQTVEASLEQEYNVGNYPILLTGPQGVGKTTYMSNIASYAAANDEGALILDFIKNCELSDSICGVVPKEKRIVIDLSKEKDLQGFGFNEIRVEKNMTTYQKLNNANLKAQYTLNLVNAINPNEPLTANMRTVLSACCNVVYSLGYTSMKDVINCLSNHVKRHKFIKELDGELKKQLEDEITDLGFIDECDKKTGEVVGTKSSKVEFILARIGLLKEDFKLKYMYNKNTDGNLDLFKAMEDHKIVIIKMPQSEFPSLMAKNVLVTYWCSKLWAVTEMRGKLYEKPKRTHLIIDEPFQAPTVMSMLKYNMPQSRKYGLKTILSTQYFDQIEEIFESLVGSFTTFMLLKNTYEKDFNRVKSLTDLEYEDLHAIKKFQSLNIVSWSGGYSSFISTLPPEIKTKKQG